MRHNATSPGRSDYASSDPGVTVGGDGHDQRLCGRLWSIRADRNDDSCWKQPSSCGKQPSDRGFPRIERADGIQQQGEVHHCLLFLDLMALITLRECQFLALDRQRLRCPVALIHGQDNRRRTASGLTSTAFFGLIGGDRLDNMVIAQPPALWKIWVKDFCSDHGFVTTQQQQTVNSSPQFRDLSLALHLKFRDITAALGCNYFCPMDVDDVNGLRDDRADCHQADRDYRSWLLSNCYGMKPPGGGSECKATPPILPYGGHLAHRSSALQPRAGRRSVGRLALTVETGRLHAGQFPANSKVDPQPRCADTVRASGHLSLQFTLEGRSTEPTGVPGCSDGPTLPSLFCVTTSQIHRGGGRLASWCASIGACAGLDLDRLLVSPYLGVTPPGLSCSCC